MDRHEPPSPQISEAEFEEILQRNKTVSSSAISRAVQDASAGLCSILTSNCTAIAHSCTVRMEISLRSIFVILIIGYFNYCSMNYIQHN